MDLTPPFNMATTRQDVDRLLAAGQIPAALQQLQAVLDTQPASVSEALLRYIRSDQPEAVANLLQQPPAGVAYPRLLDELAISGGPPRFVPQSEVDALPASLQFDVYASIVAVRGSAQAQQDLDNGQRVVLGLRIENHTAANQGRGVYDDRIVVLWRDGDQPGLAQFHHATTEPTAQYDAHAHNAPAGSVLAGVHFRRAEGLDGDGDRVLDLGRMAEGTVAMRGTTHPTPGGQGTHFSLRPTADAVDAAPQGVQRDTNGDGWFDSGDRGGVQPLNDTFKHHMGSRGNTDSAGCQTIPIRIDGNEGYYRDYLDALRGTAGQATWQYVLTHTHDEASRLGRAYSSPASAEPDNDPRMPGHPQHRLYQDIRQGVQGLGEPFVRRADSISLALLQKASEQGWTQVSAVRSSHPLPGQDTPERIFLMREGQPDPAGNRIGILATDALRADTDSVLQRLASTIPAPAQEQVQQQEAMTRGGR